MVWFRENGSFGRYAYANTSLDFDKFNGPQNLELGFCYPPFDTKLSPAAGVLFKGRSQFNLNK